MTDANSPIHDFYPTDFSVDLEGKRNDWEGVVLIPFIDEARLLAASHTVGPAKLSRVCPTLPLTPPTPNPRALGFLCTLWIFVV